MNAESTGVLGRVVSAERRELWQRSWKRFTSRPMSVVSLGIIIAIVLLVVFAPVVAPYPEHAEKFIDFSNTLQPPSVDHLLGIDHVGHDVLSRILSGCRLLLMLMAVVLGFGVPMGVLLGLVAGCYGGWTETIVMRTTDTALVLPLLVMALAITSTLRPMLTNAMIAITALWWTWHVRLVQNIVASEHSEEYVQAAKLIGVSTPHILFREILPNTLSPILVKVTLDAGFIILIGAGLSFIGVGVQSPQSGLGMMVSQGMSYLPDSWWVNVLSGLAIFVLVMGFNMLGDGLRSLFDVEMNR